MDDKMYRMAGHSEPSRVVPRTERTSGQMQGLLNEFRGLYESKLKRLDEAERSGEDNNKVSLFALFTVKHLFKILEFRTFVVIFIFRKMWFYMLRPVRGRLVDMLFTERGTFDYPRFNPWHKRVVVEGFKDKAIWHVYLLPTFEEPIIILENWAFYIVSSDSKLLSLTNE